MGVVNVTPDSFSDGGEFLDPGRAIEHGLSLIEDGADWLDIGGESTRPGADEGSAEDELARVMPVVEGLAGSAPVSIDTTKAVVAQAAIEAGATMVNDVTALLRDPGMTAVCAENDVDVVLMHMLGTPRTMQDDPRYGDVVAEVLGFLRDRADHAIAAGVEASRIWVDPGIGFGKTLHHNLKLLESTHRMCELGYPVLVGPSRKTFIGKIDGSEVKDRVGGTVAACLAARQGGATMVRVHNVAEVRQAIRVADAIQEAG